MKQILIIALGGGIGASCRHLVSLASLRALGPNFPYGTIAVNVLGSFAMGVLIELMARRFDASTELRLFLTTGMLGGFTTFSTFSLDAVTLIERGDAGLATIYLAGSIGLGLAALVAGLGLVRLFA
ncbi:fluoride efflux transporter CrcB [Consotaella aegiceratis]|uniref:fluoride efflux transporter CrcB n=1 Tax=Consotaella aegiceratis TaxID=3097961 RepID=UPI002F3FB84E